MRMAEVVEAFGNWHGSASSGILEMVGVVWAVRVVLLHGMALSAVDGYCWHVFVWCDAALLCDRVCEMGLVCCSGSRGHTICKWRRMS